MEERKEIKTREGCLRTEVEKLKIHVKELETLHEELAALLKLEQNKVKSLEDQLRDSKNISEQTRQKYEQELQTLREILLLESKEKLQQLQVILDTRVEDAVRETRTQVEREYELKIQQAIEKEQEKSALQLQKERVKILQAAEKEHQGKMQEALERESQKATQQLQQERARLEQAVEKERVKMRKLVKALAIKEKRVVAEAERRQQKATTNSGSMSASQRTSIIGAAMRPV